MQLRLPAKTTAHANCTPTSAATSSPHAANADERDERLRVIRYSTVMHRTSLRHGFQLLAGPVAEFVSKEASSAALAAKGLWRRDPSVWSIDRSVQDKIGVVLAGSTRRR